MIRILVCSARMAVGTRLYRAHDPMQSSFYHQRSCKKNVAVFKNNLCFFYAIYLIYYIQSDECDV
jgi:hypothetical protein